MPRGKRRSVETICRQKAAKRKQESPEKRAARLESARNYARKCRKNETESQREQRLKSMRNYVRCVRKRKDYKLLQQKFAVIEERSKNVQEDAPQETESVYFIEIDMRKPYYMC